MNDTKLRRRLLGALAARARVSEIIDLFSIAAACGCSAGEALHGLTELEAAGLADARRLRLTLAGLAVAAAVGVPATRASRREPRARGRVGAARRYAA